MNNNRNVWERFGELKHLLTRNIMDAEANMPYVWRYSWLRSGQQWRKMSPVDATVPISIIRQPVTSTWHDMNHAAFNRHVQQDNTTTGELTDFVTVALISSPSPFNLRCPQMRAAIYANLSSLEGS